MNKTFEELHKRFLKLRDITGATKLSSYSMTIYYNPEGGISIELGGYDIGDWARHEVISGFLSEQEALGALEEKIKEAEEEVKNYKEEEEVYE